MDFIFDPSLVLYLPLYKLDGASFMSRDAYGHLCTVTGAVWTPRGRDFDGVDDKISIPDHVAFDGVTEITALCWTQIRRAIGNSEPCLAKYETDFREWNISINTTGGINIAFGDPSDGSYEGYQATDSNIYSAEDECHLIGFTYKAGAVKIYVDEAEAASSLGGGAIPDTLFNGSAQVKVASYQTSHGEVRIGEVWIYSRALTSLEFQHNYLATKWRYR